MKIIPGYLYKYKSFDPNNYWKDILLKKRLYMARPSEFNDPFEGQLFPFGTATCGNSINLQAGQPNKDVKQFLDDYRVVCLSSNIRNKAMWAYYADNYQGFAIRFRTFKIGSYDNEKNSFSSAQRVIYKTDNEIIPCQRINGYRAAKAAQRKSLLYKSSDWKQEEEFRIIRYNKSGGPPSPCAGVRRLMVEWERVLCEPARPRTPSVSLRVPPSPVRGEGFFVRGIGRF